MDGDDGWQVATGKRTRSVKINQSNEPPAKKSKLIDQGDDLVLNMTDPVPSFEMKQRPKKKKLKQRTLAPDGIILKDLQSVIFWVYDFGINPNWIFIKVCL